MAELNLDGSDAARTALGNIPEETIGDALNFLESKGVTPKTLRLVFENPDLVKKIVDPESLEKEKIEAMLVISGGNVDDLKTEDFELGKITVEKLKECDVYKGSGEMEDENDGEISRCPECQGTGYSPEN